MDEQKIDKLIEQAINRVGQENDKQDLATLQTFLETRKLKSVKEDQPLVDMTNQTSSKIKRLWLSVASIAAIIAIVFSLNIYQRNNRMDEAFRTHYSPLEYDAQLMSRSENSPLSSDLTEAMEAYQRQDYSTALQKFNNIPIVGKNVLFDIGTYQYQDYSTVLQKFNIPYIDNNFLIYKAICLIETDQLPQAIDLLEELVSHGEATEYYQQANWYLALAYLKAHDDEKAEELLIKDIPDFEKLR